MGKTMAVSLGTILALAGVASARGHHSGSMYVTTPIWIEGTVVDFAPVNPHTITTVEQQSEGAQVRRWSVEGPGRSQLDRAERGVNRPNVGDVIRVCAFAYKPVEDLQRIFPGTDFSARRSSSASGGSPSQFVAGHVLVMPDGEKRLWEPHGVLSECIRSSDERTGSWVTFIDSDPRARQAWCEQREYAYVRSTPALQELVEEIDGSIAGPCP